MVKLKVHQISTNLVHRKLRNTTFEGKKMPTSITLPDSTNKSFTQSDMPLVYLQTFRRICKTTLVSLLTVLKEGKKHECQNATFARAPILGYSTSH